MAQRMHRQNEKMREGPSLVAPQVPSTSNTPSHVLPPLPLHYTRRIRTDHSAGIDTLLSGTPEAPSSPMVHQAPSEIVDPPLRQSIRIQVFDLNIYIYISIYRTDETRLGNERCGLITNTLMRISMTALSNDYSREDEVICKLREDPKVIEHIEILLRFILFVEIMGKKRNSWFNTVKKVFKSSSKDLSDNKKDNVEKWQHDMPDIVSFEHFPAETSPDASKDQSTIPSPVTEDRNHAIAVAVATAAAAEAAVAAAQAAAKVVRLAGYGRQSKEERAATFIQSFYRGYLIEMERWDGRNQSLESINENSQRKHDAVIRRERALAYAFTYQQQQQDSNMNSADYFGEKPQWGWNWLERWMASQPWHARHMAPPDSSYAALTNTDDTSEKTVEMDMVTPPGSDSGNMGRLGRNLVDSAPYTTLQQQQQRHTVPSYMAATQSAKAKVRSQGSVKQRAPQPQVAQWNQSTRRVSVALSGADSSSSGGGTTATYQIPRSPGPKVNGVRMQSGRLSGYSPDSSGGNDRTPPFGSHGRRRDFG
ncbi:hypothetical protein HHK36_027498 [Tetracentron sinense]|uniref:DUF4005 domain-containing protein n=1 Tax=Tetracentron sinense TaxID=13715 RepID=A0A834YE56_TETSI|nr:hypothetical protein HHK36_027498 [Tetracentron sinense]